MAKPTQAEIDTVARKFAAHAGRPERVTRADVDAARSTLDDSYVSRLDRAVADEARAMAAAAGRAEPNADDLESAREQAAVRLAVGDAHEALGIGKPAPEPEPLAPGADPVAHALRTLGITR